MSTIDWQLSRNATGIVYKPNSTKALYLIIGKSGPTIHFATMESSTDEEPFDAMQRLFVEGDHQIAARTFEDTIILAEHYADKWLKATHLEVVK